MKQIKDPDATVMLRAGGRLEPPASTTPLPPGLGSRRGFLLGAAAVAAAAVVGGGVLLRRATRHVPAQIPLAEEQAILATDAPVLRAWRFAQAPSVVVLIFPSLHAQAIALNRAAVFLELAGASRTEVPDDETMGRDIDAAHLDADTFYYGHDYRAADLMRMWTLADRQGVKMRPEEAAVRALLLDAAAAPDGLGAVISLPPPGTGLQDHAGRAAILRHELSHGVYFTDPEYAAAVDVFWRARMTQTQREAFRHFLGGEAYDPNNDELMRNEAQAYLVHTADPRFFSAAVVGLPEAEVNALRNDFIARMPAGWLKARTVAR